MASPEYHFTTLPTKPTAQLSYSYTPPTTTSQDAPLIVFVNGLGLPQSSWAPAMSLLTDLRPGNCPAMLTFDRYGQGQTTDRDPQDAQAEDPMHGHDCMSAVDDIHQLITKIANEKMGITDVDRLPLVLVANSIGCALSRLYAQTHLGKVAGIILLDSVLANSDFVSIYPDPDVAGFDPSTLPEGITPDTLRLARTIMMKIFHPSNGSREGLSRRNLASLLPLSDGPVLQGVAGKGPWLTVVGHDFETFAEGSKMMGMPYEATMAYANPYWHEYNQSLVKCTEEGRGKGSVIAPGADHFIQRDNPTFVAEEIDEMLGKIF